jgi:hypothetical protein
MALSILLASTWGDAGQTNRSDLFSRAAMQEIDLQGLRVWLGQPVQVTAQLGWKIGWPQYEWEHAFTHLTPTMARFPKGELIATYTLDSDTQTNPVFASGFQISKDGGAHWGRRYSMLMQHINMIFIPKPNDSMMALPSELFEQTPGDEHNFVGPYYLFERGGERMVFVPDGVRVVDWPWPVDVFPGSEPRDDWHAGLVLTGNALKVGHKLLATGYFHKKGDKGSSAVILSSGDGGYTWRYLSTVAGPDPSLVSQRSYEGADEMTMIQLADGDLMAVFRVGSGRKWNLHRAYSHDQGRTWSQADTLPAWSVYPQLLRTANGTIALATGRPGIDLWLSTDPRGTNWQSIDIAEHHNDRMTDPSERIGTFEITSNPYLSENTKWQTSSYTGLVEVGPNRLLLLYDRDPERIPREPNDLSRVFVMPIEIGSN